MGMLEDLLGKAVPGGGISKPLLIALGALILSGALTGKKGAAPSTPTPLPGGTTTAGGESSGGGFSLPNLGGALAGGAAGGALLNGLGGLIDMFTKGGQKSAIDSWVGSGENKQVSAGDLGSLLPPDILRQLQQQTGLGQGDLLSQLSQILPELINGMTPNGRMPTEQEVDEDYGRPAGQQRGPGGILDELSRMSESLGGARR